MKTAEINELAERLRAASISFLMGHKSVDQTIKLLDKHPIARAWKTLAGNLLQEKICKESNIKQKLSAARKSPL